MGYNFPFYLPKTFGLDDLGISCKEGSQLSADFPS